MGLQESLAMTSDPPDDSTDDSPEDVARTAEALRSGRARPGLDELRLRLPAWTIERPVRESVSWDDTGTRYVVDLHALTCSCPDFMQRRAAFADRDPRRLCKHLRTELGDGLLRAVGEIEGAIVRAGCAKAELYRATVSTNRSVVLGITPADPWIDVFARTFRRGDQHGDLSGPYATYGFNAREHSWSYGSVPVGAGELRRLFKLSGILAEVAPAPAVEAVSSDPGPSQSERDLLFCEAAAVVIEHRLGSTSLLQRRLKIGYGRALRLIDQLYKAGIIGAPDGSKPRDVLWGMSDLARICD